MSSTASKTVALVIVLSALTAGCSKVREYQSRYEAQSASEEWIAEGGIYFRGSRFPLVKPKDSNISNSEWNSKSRIDKHYFICNAENERRKQAVDKGEDQVLFGFPLKRGSDTWQAHFGQSDCRKEYGDILRIDLDRKTKTKLNKRECLEEDNQFVCSEATGISDLGLVFDGDNFDLKMQVKRYFRWWTR